MTGSTKIRVPGYAQRIFYNDGIEYRPFSPDLVGNQETSVGSNSLFTNGNFRITTNLDSKTDRNFITNNFSNFVTLSTLDLTHDEATQLLEDNAEIFLNLDKTNLNYYAYFGSLVEFIRVSLESIIINWPASLYITPIITTDNFFGATTANTIENYAYDIINNTTTFKVNTNTINNKFNINFLTNGNIINTFSETNDLRNLTVNYESYSILYNNDEYNILEFTGSTNLINDYLYLKVNGNPFSGIVTNSTLIYHIKPNFINVEKFFNSLNNFEGYLLNRQTLPLYTAIFKFPLKSDDGVLLYVTDSFTWSTSDGYNIDFDTTKYSDYATKLLNIGTESDLYKSDIISRFLVSQSISDFDSLPSTNSDSETAGQKINKLLKIYGRNFDELRNYIEGITFANVVTYNKQDNTPDVILKNLARTLGWNLTSSLVDNDLISDYITPNQSTYSGQTIGYTPVESENELWRRLILNTPWLWKSKGSRKSIEFLFKFIGAPNGLINFNEYIYSAKENLSIDLFKEVLKLNNLDTDITNYNLDENGYPKVFTNTSKLYFQKGGLWFRQTAGTGATIDIIKGNNPHVGPYDNGLEYINQFNNLIPNFSAVTISSQTITTSSENLFVNYNLGLIDNCNLPVYPLPIIGLITDNNLDLSGCYLVTSEIINDPKPEFVTSDCGCVSDDCDQALKICVKKNTNITSGTTVCTNTIDSINTNINGYIDFNYYQYDINGNIISATRPSIYVNPDCCSVFGGKPELYTEYNNLNQETNIGYICCIKRPETCGCFITCKWVLGTTNIGLLPLISGDRYLLFVTPDGQKRVVSPDGCNCVGGLTIPTPNITDPYTGEIGFGCKLTPNGYTDISLPLPNQILYNTYIERKNGLISCDSVSSIISSSSSSTE